jgi:hypothetical protein
MVHQPSRQRPRPGPPLLGCALTPHSWSAREAAAPDVNCRVATSRCHTRETERAADWRYTTKVGLHGGYALQEHRAQAVVLLGRRGGYCLSDDGEGEERQGGILLDEPVHRCLERAARAGRRRVSRMGRRGQIRGDPVCQGAPASRTGSPCLGPCARKGRCFDMVVVGGVYHRRHHTTPCPSMLSIRHGGCLLRTCQSAGTGGVEEGQSSLCSLIMKKYPFLYQKRKTIIFIVSIKKSNK